MTWRDVVVHLKHYKDWSPHIDVAIEQARRHKARLTGLYTLRDLAMTKLLYGADSEAAKQAEARAEPRISRAEQRFRQAASVAGVEVDWQIGEGNADEVMSVAGRYHDLIVVEQTEFGVDEVGQDVAAACALSAGRPTLIVPAHGHFHVAGERVLVAWNNSRQAASAVQAALPMLAAAQQVTVVIGEGKERHSSITKPPKLDIVAYLKQHTASVEAMPFEAAEADAGERLLIAARDSQSDILVMGAYGRPAWRELVLGGATRHVLRQMRLPVLMAH